MRIDLLIRVGAVPSGVYLVADLVKRWITLAALVEVFVLLAPLLLDGPLPDGAGSCLVSGPLLSPGVGKSN